MSSGRSWWAAVLLLYACTNEMRFALIDAGDPLPVGGTFGTGATGPGEAGATSVPGGGDDAGGQGTGAAGAAGTPGVEIPQPVGPSGPFMLTHSEECEGELGPDWITYWVPEPLAPSDRTIGHTAEYVADDHVSVVGGLCVIVADDTDSPEGYDRSYTSGAMNTAQRFEQGLGYFEARLKAISGRGVWTDWRLRTVEGWPPAIDVADIFGRAPSTVRMANYWGAAYPNHSAYIEHWTGPDFSNSFHVFGVERTETELIWYVDGVERSRTTEGADYQGPRYLSLAILVGTGDEPSEPPDETTVWPVELSVDWVRAWERE